MSPKRLINLQIDAMRQFNASRSDGNAARRLLHLVDALGLVAAAIESTDWAAADNTPAAMLALKEVRALWVDLAEAADAARQLLAPDFAQRLDAALKALLSLTTHRGGSHRSAGRHLEPPAPAPKTNDAALQAVEVPYETASFGAGAPQSVAPGSHFCARFIVYPADQIDAAQVLLDAGAPRGIADTSVIGIGGAAVSRGAVLQVALSGEGLSIEGAPKQVQTLCWSGRPVLLTFDVEAAAVHAGLSTMLRFDVFLDGLQLAWVRLPLELSPAAEASSCAQRTTVGHKLARRAFASYASADRTRVLDRVAAIRITAGIEVFVDRVALQPGERWQERLAKEIDTCDTFMLFWSGAAKKSYWVRWEWERALERPGIEFMQFHPLVNGVRPPPQLNAIHLADALMDLRTASAMGDKRQRTKGEG